ncbi:hypothetical protein L3X38_017792 [Prunus dulcis]|uniref:Uncharacterized protein n=1 Tax=Prunus dulcis TaxID=3755 RepID=A0AAD4WAE3_PRUDU|nr:hypothetical protein L3X38_017792 [Prunus dulcis]
MRTKAVNKRLQVNLHKIICNCCLRDGEGRYCRGSGCLRERNALQLRVGQLERELKETSRWLVGVEDARVEAEQKKVEELAVSRVEAIEEYKGSEGFKNLVLDAMVEEQFGWEKTVVRFNPELDINFDTSGAPPPIPSGRELLFESPSSSDATSPDVR